MTWLQENIKLLMILSLLVPGIFWCIFAFISEMPKDERRMWIVSGVYATIFSALLLLLIGP